MRFYLDEENFDPVMGKIFYYQQWLCPECVNTIWKEIHNILFDDNQAYRCGYHPCTVCTNETINLSRDRTTGYPLHDEIIKALNEWKELSSKYYGKHPNIKEDSDKWILKWKDLGKQRMPK